jgi:hypothetical protein
VGDLRKWQHRHGGERGERYEAFHRMMAFGARAGCGG